MRPKGVAVSLCVLGREKPEVAEDNISHAYFLTSNSHTMKKINFPLIFGLSFIAISLTVGIISIIDSFKTEKPTKPETNCAILVYFNYHTHRLDTAYSNMVTLDDSLMSFTDPRGKKITPKEFVSEQDETDKDEDDNDYTTTRHILLLSGERFEISPLTDSLCQSKRIMDSISKTE